MVYGHISGECNRPADIYICEYFGRSLVNASDETSFLGVFNYDVTAFRHSMDSDSCNPRQCTRLAAAMGFQEQKSAEKQIILLRAQIASGRPIIPYEVRFNTTNQLCAYLGHQEIWYEVFFCGSRGCQECAWIQEPAQDEIIRWWSHVKIEKAIQSTLLSTIGVRRRLAVVRVISLCLIFLSSALP